MFDVLTTICTVTGIVVWVCCAILVLAYTFGVVEIGTDIEETAVNGD